MEKHSSLEKRSVQLTSPCEKKYFQNREHFSQTHHFRQAHVVRDELTEHDKKRRVANIVA